MITTPASRKGSRGAHQDGFTLVEVATAASVLALLSVLVAHSLANLSRTQSFNRGQVRIAEIADRVMRGAERDVSHSIRILTADDPQSPAYLAALDLPATAIANGSVLPALTHRGYFDRDAAAKVETGNMIALGVLDTPVVVDLAPQGVTPDLVRVDVMRFVVYHLEVGGAGALDLSRWSSVRLARYEDITDVTDLGRRSVLLAALYDMGVRWSWDTGARTAALAFFEIYQAGWIGPMAQGDAVPRDPVGSRSAILAPRRLRIAGNGETKSAAVPAFAAAAGLFPSGFEAKVDGPPSGRMVLLRLVMVGQSIGGVLNAAETTRLIGCRDG